jgi:hypothetical protein
MRATLSAGLLLLALPASGPAAAQITTATAICANGGEALVRTTLYFGRDIPGGGTVGETQWRDFLRHEVTPRFPKGFSVWDAHGQWRSDDGTIAREKSKVLTVVRPDTEDVRSLVRAVVDSYRRLFRQEAVLWEDEAVCAAFAR